MVVAPGIACPMASPPGARRSARSVRSQTPIGDGDMVVWRFLEDGTLDTSFGGQGWITQHDAAGGGTDDLGAGIVVAPDGRLVVAGRSMSAANHFDMTVWVLDEAGSLDPSFATGGVFTHDGAAGANGWDQGSSVAFDTRLRILVTGISNNAADSDMTVWRLE